MVSGRYFLEVCEATCWKWTPLAAVMSTKFPGVSRIACQAAALPKHSKPATPRTANCCLGPAVTGPSSHLKPHAGLCPSRAGYMSTGPHPTRPVPRPLRPLSKAPAFLFIYRFHQRVPEMHSCPVQQNTQVGSIHTKTPAQFRLVHFSQEGETQQIPVLFGELSQDLTHQLLPLLCDQLHIWISPGAGRLLVACSDLGVTAPGTYHLQRDVMTDRVHKSGEAFGVIQDLT